MFAVLRVIALAAGGGVVGGALIAVVHVLVNLSAERSDRAVVVPALCGAALGACVGVLVA